MAADTNIVKAKSSSRRAYRFELHSIYSQNWHGLKTESSFAEMTLSCKQRNAFAVCGQETWRAGFVEHESNGYTFVGIGPPSQSRRTSSPSSVVRGVQC